MTITVDCNSDRIEIEEGNTKIEMVCKNPTNVIKILQEIFNLIGAINDDFHVTLEKIDEDNRTNVDEW